MKVSNKDYKFINMAANAADKSSMLMKHGCVITCNNKFICDGFNSDRTQFQDNFINISCSCHAEMDALRKLIRIKSKGKKHSYSHRKTIYDKTQRRNRINNNSSIYKNSINKQECFFRNYYKDNII